MINVYDRGKHDGAMIPEEIFDVHTAIAYDIFWIEIIMTWSPPFPILYDAHDGAWHVRETDIRTDYHVLDYGCLLLAQVEFVPW